MGKEGYLVLTFESTHAAMAAQKYLKDKIPHVVMPVPRCISASCGIAIRVENGELERLKPLLGNGFPVEGDSYRLYRVDSQDRAEALALGPAGH